MWVNDLPVSIRLAILGHGPRSGEVDIHEPVYDLDDGHRVGDLLDSDGRVRCDAVLLVSISSQ